jgi:N-acetylneuraminate synthase
MFGNSTYIIGEIGINHNGDLGVVKRLIDIAVVAGFDAVKFQKRNPNKCVPGHQKKVMRQTPWGQMPYIDYKRRVEFGRREYNAIDRYCMQKGIEWSASPWDTDSVDFLADYDLPWVKIASASITDSKLINSVGTTFENVIISTGMSTEKQIDNAIRNTAMHMSLARIAILHCNSSYPAPVKDLNLNYITKLKEMYPECTIGYSGHEYGLGPSIAAVALGAKVIERHITLDKGMWGTDQACSLEPHAMFKLVRGIRELELALGKDEKIVTEDELEKAKSLRK